MKTLHSIAILIIFFLLAMVLVMNIPEYKPFYPTPTGEPITYEDFNPILGGGNISAGEPTYTIHAGTNLLTPEVANQVIRGDFK